MLSSVLPILDSEFKTLRVSFIHDMCFENDLMIQKHNPEHGKDIDFRM